MLCSSMLERAITTGVARESHGGRHRCKDLGVPQCLAFTQAAWQRYSLNNSPLESQ